jgi:glycyl-tRNA synthetase beta chain
MEATLLVELLTEELPPKSLRELSEAFSRGLRSTLDREGFLSSGSVAHAYATPRRLAVRIASVRDRSPDTEREVQGPAVTAPAQAVAGFARKHGVAVEALRRNQTPKGEVHVALVKTSGQPLDSVLGAAAGEAVKGLPIPKIMYWGDGDAQFVRPVHGVILLYGDRAIAGSVLGVAAGRVTRGHRFMGTSPITLATADEYEARLLEEGCVIADFGKRRAEIERLLLDEALRQKASLADYQVLLDEVTALVEHPSVYVGTFDAGFLSVPQECLILTMRQNQKYFPLFDAAQKLLPKFLIVSNMRVADPRHIIGGNERVVRPRLEDARFFYDQDRKTRLEDRVPQLAKVVYHNKLGSQLERVERIQLLAGHIARALGTDPAHAERAAWLAKADLITGMVGEFPELQGTMGRYYALHDGEPQEVADAIEAHYRPRFSGDRLPEGPTACAVALADKMETLAGLFSIGQQPTGDKDPFGLRRAALGLVRIVVENSLSLSLPDLIRAAFGQFPVKNENAAAELLDFVFERFAGYLRDKGYTALQVDSVLTTRPAHLSVVPGKLEAVKAFQALPEAESLAEANKRIRNILRKSEAMNAQLDTSLLTEKEEQALYEFMQSVNRELTLCVQRGDYEQSLKVTATVQPSVTAFFDKVLVNADDPRLRANRHALLRDLGALLNQVADISKLAQ